MSRFVQADVAAARQGEPHKSSPARRLDRPQRNVGGGKGRHCRIEIIAHKEEFVAATRFGRVHRDLAGWEGEDQPAMPRIDIWKAEYVANESAIGLRIAGIKNDMSPADHASVFPLLSDCPRESVKMSAYARLPRAQAGGCGLTGQGVGPHHGAHDQHSRY